MTRRNYGSHGEICVRVNGRMMMTVRPQPEVLTPEQCAEILAYRCLDLDGYSHFDAVEAIADYEDENGKMTQKEALNILDDTWCLANQSNYTDMMVDYDEDDYNHRAVLAWVLRIFPKFSRDLTEEEVGVDIEVIINDDVEEYLTTLAQQEESE